VAAAHFVALVLLQRLGFVLAWGRQSTKVSLDEFAILVGLVALPPPIVVANVVASALANQVATRRPPVKATFNVAQYGLGAALAAMVFALLVAQGVSTVLAAATSPFVFAFSSQGSLAFLLARLDDAPFHRVFRERFAPWALATASIGVSLGLAAIGLWNVHPLAVLALAPIFLLMTRYGRLAEWADGELRARMRLADMATRVAGDDDVDAAAMEVLEACGDIFEAGEAVLTYAPDGVESRTWRWRHRQGASARGVRVAVPNGRGVPGSLAIYPRPNQRAYGQRDVHLLEIVAGAVGAAAANVQALTESREAAMRLRKANRELEEFTLWTTHDMREPLRSVGALASILEDEIHELPPGEAKELASRIRRGADGLKDRIKALHEFSRIVQEDAAFETVDMNDVLDSVVAGLEARVAERDACIECRDALPTVRAQRARFEKVLANLLENALKYNDHPEPRVVVAAVERESTWEFVVRDNGPGIEPLYRDRVFQLFQRGPHAKEPGSGAGLAIVKRIVEQHGGRVWILDAEGGGAEFRFTVPKRVSAAAPEPAVRLAQASFSAS
jgi:signal transduction histidine kinase